MERVLVSWSAYTNNFIYEKNDFKEEGPHGEIYNHLFNYDKHYLLTTAKELKDDIRMEYLCNYLKNKNKAEVIPVPMAIYYLWYK